MSTDVPEDVSEADAINAKLNEMAEVAKGWTREQFASRVVEMLIYDEGNLGKYKRTIETILDVHERVIANSSARSTPAGVKLDDVPDDNDGKEQDAFEEWAASERFDMETHPLFWAFLDKETDAARRGWRAGITYARQRILSALTTEPQAEAVDERVQAYRDADPEQYR